MTPPLLLLASRGVTFWTGPDRAAPCGHHRDDFDDDHDEDVSVPRHADNGVLCWLIAD